MGSTGTISWVSEHMVEGIISARAIAFLLIAFASRPRKANAPEVNQFATIRCILTLVLYRLRCFLLSPMVAKLPNRRPSGWHHDWNWKSQASSPELVQKAVNMDRISHTKHQNLPGTSYPSRSHFEVDPHNSEYSHIQQQETEYSC